MIEALGLEGAAREAGLVLASRHEAEVAGEPLRAFFEGLGASVVG